MAKPANKLVIVTEKILLKKVAKIINESLLMFFDIHWAKRGKDKIVVFCIVGRNRIGWHYQIVLVKICDYVVVPKLMARHITAQEPGFAIVLF